MVKLFYLLKNDTITLYNWTTVVNMCQNVLSFTISSLWNYDIYVRYSIFNKVHCCCVWSCNVQRDQVVTNFYLAPQYYHLHIEKLPTQISPQL